MTWRDARSIDVLAAEINAAYPDRSTASDGTIGDAAHAARDSDHNPWVILNSVGIVRARDVTHDPDHGCDCDVLAERVAGLIALGAHPALRHGAYVIRNRRIFSFDRRDEGWRPYTGSNPHEKHMHVSVSLDPAGFDSTAPWGITEEEDVVDDATIDKIADRAVEKLLGKQLGNGLTVQANLRKAGDTKELAKEIARELNRGAKTASTTQR
jgi:hypothetical protein